MRATVLVATALVLLPASATAQDDPRPGVPASAPAASPPAFDASITQVAASTRVRTTAG